MKKIAFFTIFNFIIIFVFFEILARAIYPELSGQIHKYVNYERTISKSKNTWYRTFSFGDGVKYRHHSRKSNSYLYGFEKYPGYDKKTNELIDLKRKKNIFLFGDCVTGGFGVNLQETYFFYAENLLNQNKKKKDFVKIYSIARFGDNFRDMKKGITLIEKIIKKEDIILYQFNYNDIVEVNYAPPLSKDTLDELSSKEPSSIKVYFNDLRKSFFNHSTFMRTLQHYAGILKWKLQKVSSLKNMVLKQELFKKCGSLGFSTLGQYTFSYGAKNFQDKSKKIWEEFEKDLIVLNNYLKSKELKFAIIISPISLQIPYHEEINHRGLNFSCSTIDAQKKIKEILVRNSIDFIDPIDDFIEYTEVTKQNNNFNLLFHPYDTNHPNEFGHYLIGKKLYSYLHNLLKY